MVEILRQLVEAEGVRNAVHAPGLGLGLEGADQELAGILLVIGAGIHVAHDRQIGGQIHGLGHDIEMLGGMERHGDAGHEPDLPRPHAGAVHHHLGLDLALARS